MARRAENSEILRVVLASSDVACLRALHREATTAGFEVIGAAREPGSVPTLLDRITPVVLVAEESFVVAGRDVATVLITEFDGAIPAPHVMALLGRPPYRRGELKAVVQLATRKYAEMDNLREELNARERDLEDRKILERAKGLLMQDLHLTEAEAFQRLRKMSMDRREPLAQIAGAILAAYKIREEASLSLF